MLSQFNAASTASTEVVSAAALARITEALRSLRFGHVTVFVQDGTIVLIERTEKQRVS